MNSRTCAARSASSTSPSVDVRAAAAAHSVLATRAEKSRHNEPSGLPSVPSERFCAALSASAQMALSCARAAARGTDSSATPEGLSEEGATPEGDSSSSPFSSPARARLRNSAWMVCTRRCSACLSARSLLPQACSASMSWSTSLRVESTPHAPSTSSTYSTPFIPPTPHQYVRWRRSFPRLFVRTETAASSSMRFASFFRASFSLRSSSAFALSRFASSASSLRRRSMRSFSCCLRSSARLRFSYSRLSMASWLETLLSSARHAMSALRSSGWPSYSRRCFGSSKLGSGEGSRGLRGARAGFFSGSGVSSFSSSFSSSSTVGPSLSSSPAPAVSPASSSSSSSSSLSSSSSSSSSSTSSPAAIAASRALRFSSFSALRFAAASARIALRFSLALFSTARRRCASALYSRMRA
mmetsp:Transcript_11307/g.47430  ORF Transcript_11307/g.47430 Transcript_11307/m.47430 type:complete len:413 (-) Transcript_11307:167-1405(-)